jgi:cysteinyl-tRNA synthetase
VSAFWKDGIMTLQATAQPPASTPESGLRLYDSAAQEVRAFTPLHAGQAGLYVCGLTVQGLPHLGHVRSALVFDVLRRWLTIGHGLDVTLVRNVTDIDDKILTKAAEAGVPWWAWAYTHEQAVTRAYTALGITPPTYEPRATGHITEMVTLMERLIERGHAYDLNGSVYFDVSSFPEYGGFTRQNLSDMLVDDLINSGKRHPLDFALWKARKATEPSTASWPTPWGTGRPGWHLECSAMATRYLGPEFDIHGGGLDLRFPHHENEIAQSRAAGDGFARYWLHNHWVTMGGEKMAKSLGNVALVDEVIKRVRPVELRYYLATPHYRSMVEFTEPALQEAASAYQRIESFVRKAAERVGPNSGTPALPRDFVNAMNNDLGTPAAVAVIHDTVRAGFTALAANDDPATSGALALVRAMLNVLGLDPLDAQWATPAAGHGDADLLDGLINLVLEQRATARANRDYAAADALRDRLTALGLRIEDGPTGAHWQHA